MMREGKNWWTAWRVGRWNRATGERGSGRPLLTAAGTEEEERDDSERPNNSQQREYGGTDEEGGGGPRVDPSPIHHERNAWDDEHR